MFQILKKLFLVILCLSLLSSFAFADDLTILEGEEFNTFGSLTASDYGVSSVQWAASFVFQFGRDRLESHTFALSSSSPSDSVRLDQAYSDCYNSATTISIPAGTLTVNFFTGISSATSSNPGVSVSKSGNTLTVVSDGTSSPINVNLKMFEDFQSLMDFTVSASFTPSGSGGGGTEPEDPFAGTGSMFGWTGKTIFGLQTKQEQHWYTNGSGSDRVGHLDATYEYGDAVSVPGYWVMQNMVASLTVQKWQWKIKPETGLPAFNVDENYKGTWSDMIYRTSVYNYFWGEKLWGNDVSGSWYGSISSDFSYLNFRVNQILDVLANDEDLAIKDATTPERDWVKGYFSGSGDKADSTKYNSLNSDGQALKDFLTPSESASMSDALSAVESQGYSFWSENVYQDINQISSTATTDLGDDVPWEEQINDLYSEHLALIGGAFYD